MDGLNELDELDGLNGLVKGPLEDAPRSRTRTPVASPTKITRQVTPEDIHTPQKEAHTPEDCQIAKIMCSLNVPSKRKRLQIDDKLSVRAQKTIEAGRQHHHMDIYFDSKDEAKQYCIHKYTIGVFEQNGKFVVRVPNNYNSIAMASVKGVQWLYLKCWHKSKERYYVVNMEENPTPIDIRGGIVRQKYRLPDGMCIKIYHNTCAYTDMEELCDSCKKPKWNSGCKIGNCVFLLTT